ncbi:PAS domain S-box protein [Spirosoma sp. HMF3257]|uniref:Sensory/regulatory protein RpfC n=1 Tax=Spirosoma telluris TaxID=2183553 RepID=A0A327NJ94_9BACT|nr:PAS domain S-box protein [Spirosoma telluris]RAI74905.1 hybrid sensor histidine kinase/response regulator [Spirosoma telluris]
MNFHKLLSKQIQRHLPEELRDNPAMGKFLDVISTSYKALERDRELVERAFTISECEYVAVNTRLKHEIDLKKRSVEELKETVNTISGVEVPSDSNDLLAIARLLNQQVNKRKNAEEVFTSLIANMQSGVLLEDENRKIVFTNQVFCDLFGIEAPPDLLQGMDCSNTAEQTKGLFRHSDSFVERINTILSQKKLVMGELLKLVNGSTLQRDYIPIFIDQKYKGHLWSYTDITERKRNQDALEQSELKNRLIMNAALDAIVTIDLAGLITFWNPQSEKIFGWKAAEVIGKRLSDIIIPDIHRASHERGMKHYIKTGNGPVLGKQMELHAINREGKSFPIELYIIPVKQGEDEFFCSFIRDISDRKKTEETLERLSLVASANKNGIVFVGLDRKIFWSNEGFSKLTGYSNAEIIGKTPIELCKGPFSDRASLRTMIESFEKGIAFDIEGIHYKKDGSWFWGRTQGQPVVNKQGEITHYFSMVEDISAEKVAQRKLKEYEERLRMALTNVGDNYWEHDFRTGKTYFSNPGNNLLGFQLEEFTNVATLWWSRVHPEDKLILEENDRKYKAGLITNHHNEYRMIHNDETIRWVLDRGVVTEKDDDNKPLKIIGTHIDITRQKELEFELTYAKEVAEESTKAKELFLANMSHEIRTPMNAIMGMANQLTKTPLTPDQLFYLNTIQSATDNLLIIINDILDLSKIEAGKLSLEKIGFEPKLVVERAMQVMIHKAQEKGLLFTNSFFDPRLSPVLIGDPYRITQVLLNLVSNAIKFTLKGSVDISCRVIQDNNEEQLIEATVRDTGIGMNQSFSKNLFQNFSQEDESVTRRFGGTGLGLSITKNLVELMGGTLQVESKKGIGSSVSFRIPFRKGSQENLPIREIAETNTDILPGKRILVADDNVMNRLVASTILKNYGALIDEAQNGLEAVEKLRLQHFDLVLMDVQMPVMDGLEATREIRSTLSEHLPVIALTAFAVKGDNQKCINAGMSDYLSKPFEESHLLAVVSKWLVNTEISVQKMTELTAQKVEPEACPLFDLSKLNSMAKGDDSFVNRMIDLFIEYGPEAVHEIKAAYAAGDFEKIRTTAHRVKPSIDILGITSLSETIKSMEAKADIDGTSEQLENLIDQLASVIDKVVNDLTVRQNKLYLLRK